MGITLSFCLGKRNRIVLFGNEELSCLGARSRLAWERGIVLLGNEESSYVGARNHPAWEQGIVLIRNEESSCLGTKNFFWGRDLRILFCANDQLFSSLLKAGATSGRKRATRDFFRRRGARGGSPPDDHDSDDNENDDHDIDDAERLKKKHRKNHAKRSENVVKSVRKLSKSPSRK